MRCAIADTYERGAADSQPAFGITIGVLRDEEPLIDDVAELRSEGGQLTTGRTWVGACGAPTTCDDVPIELLRPRALSEAVLASTVPAVMFTSGETWGAFAALRGSVPPGRRPELRGLHAAAGRRR